MTIQIDDLGCFQGGARGGIVRWTTALAFAVAAALIASTASAEASAREIKGALSYGFADSLLPNNALEHPKTGSPFFGGAPRCFVNCGPAIGAYVVRRSELLSSNTQDVSARKVFDASGHPMGVSGMIVIERLEAGGFGADWVVVGERTLDSEGTHSWALLSSAVSRDAPWLPTNLYQFEGSTVSMDFAAGALPGATPETSTWAMMLIGFAGLGFVGYRGPRNSAVLNTDAQWSALLMHGRPQRRSTRFGLTPAPLRRRPSNDSGNRDVKMKPAKNTAEVSAHKLPILEAEMLGLRQLLAEVKANRDDLRQETDDLRRDRDHWQKLAEQAGHEGMGRRAWFCGRASSRNEA